ncbi:MAG TPA: hypothetical protein VFF06_27035 [Polyangia bacterium]|nr:hypothetical protein [Polyangia bacterium]
MKHNGTLKGLWIVRISDAGAGAREVGAMLARVEAELYVLAFSSAVRAGECMRALGAAGTPFYVCAANLEVVLGEARQSGARGFIVDYDARAASFASAHPLPSGGGARELR